MTNYRTHLLGLIGIAMSVLSVFVLTPLAPDYFNSFALLGLGGALLAYPIAKVLSGATPWYAPHAFILAALALQYVAAPIAVIAFSVESQVYDRMLSPQEMMPAVLWGVVGTGCYLIGYRLGPRKQTFPKGVEWFLADTPSAMQTFNFLVMGLWVAGILAWTYMFFVVGGGAEQLMTHMSTGRDTLKVGAGGIIFRIAKFAWIAVLLYLARNGLNIVSVGMIVSTAGYLFLYGSRSYVGILLIGCLIVWRFRFAERVPWWIWAGGAFGLVFFMGFWAMLRATGGDVSQAAELYTRATDTWEGRILSFLGYFQFIIQMAEVIDNMGGRIDWQYGRTFGQILYFMPQSVWYFHDNFPSGSAVYTQALLGDRHEIITVTPSIMAEFYMNFGAWGVIVCSLIMGWLSKWFTVKTVMHPFRRHQIAWICFAAAMGVNMVRVMKNGVGTLAWGFDFFVPIAIVYFSNLKFLLSPPDEPVPPLLDGGIVKKRLFDRDGGDGAVDDPRVARDPYDGDDDPDALPEDDQWAEQYAEFAGDVGGYGEPDDRPAR